MGQKRVGTPSVSRIAEAQIDLVRELCIPEDEAAGTCWACRFGPKAVAERNAYRARVAFKPLDFTPTRCHIKPHCDGADNTDPTNFILLCEPCHARQPDTASREAQLAWLRCAKRYDKDEGDREVVAAMRKYMADVIPGAADSGSAVPTRLAEFTVMAEYDLDPAGAHASVVVIRGGSHGAGMHRDNAVSSMRWELFEWWRKWVDVNRDYLARAIAGARTSEDLRLREERVRQIDSMPPEDV